MMISKRTALLIVGVVVIVVIIVLLLFLPKSKKTAPTPRANNQQTSTNTTTPVKPKPVVTESEKAAADAATVAKSFVERFGSYSSESEAANLKDVLSLTTSSYRATLEAQIAKLTSSTPSATYYGVTTRVLSTTTKSVDASSASFDVLTQREEANGALTNTSIKYQTITIVLKLEGGVWLVDSAVWK